MEVTFSYILVVLDLFNFYLDFFLFCLCCLCSVQLGFFFQHLVLSVLGFVLEGSFGWWVLRFISSLLRSYCKLLASPTHGLDISLPLSVCYSQIDLLSFEVSMDYFGILRFIIYPVVSVSFFKDADTMVLFYLWEYLTRFVLNAISGSLVALVCFYVCF